MGNSMGDAIGNAANWIVKTYKSLENHVFGFFKRGVASHSDRNHPENKSPYQLSHSQPVTTTIKPLATNKTAKETVIPEPLTINTPAKETVTIEPLVTNTTMKASEISTEVLSNKCSDFYLACRFNKIDEVQEFLEKIERDEIERKEIDRMEPNGSTALHAASFNGHLTIVRLLLEAGADRAIFNIYDCLPFEEAKNEEIQQLFLRIPNSNRLKSDAGTIVWDLIGDNVLANALQERYIIKFVYDNVTGATPIDTMFEEIENNYIGNSLVHFEGIEKIKRFFRSATEEQDPIWIIKAYTAETDFYKILNREIAGGAGQCETERRYIIALLSYHPKLNELSYIGTSYRVMQITDDDLKRYKVGCSLMTKSFLSSSIDDKTAAWFLYQQELKKKESNQKQQGEVSPEKESNQLVRRSTDGKLIKKWVMCRYHIKHQRTALRIQNSSQYIMEREILIMPYTLFKVKQIEQVQRSELADEPFTEIELEEYDQYKIVPKNKK